jgi:hypothetical protein
VSRRVVTLERYREIKRLLAARRDVPKIGPALHCSRRLVRRIRDGLSGSLDRPNTVFGPLWITQSHCAGLIHDLRLGFRRRSSGRVLCEGLRAAAFVIDMHPTSRNSKLIRPCLARISASVTLNLAFHVAH